MTAISLTEASTRLPELVRGLAPGDVLVITENEQPVAQLTVASAEGAKQPDIDRYGLAQPQPACYGNDAESQAKQGRKLGTMRGTVLHIADDFDAPLEDFEESL